MLEIYSLTAEAVPRKIQAVRAFMLLALFAQIAALFHCVLMGLQKTEKKLIAIVMFLTSGNPMALFTPYA